MSAFADMLGFGKSLTLARRDRSSMNSSANGQNETRVPMALVIGLLTLILSVMMALLGWMLSHEGRVSRNEERGVSVTERLTRIEGKLDRIAERVK